MSLNYKVFSIRGLEGFFFKKKKIYYMGFTVECSMQFTI